MMNMAKNFITQVVNALDLSQYDFVVNGYHLDLNYAQTIASDYKDLIWLILTMVSTGGILLGLYLPQRNMAKHKVQEATLSLIHRWNSQNLPHALNTYQQEVAQGNTPLINSDAKTALYSFFHTVEFLIKEKKVDESLVRKSQIGLGFISFYSTVVLEHPDMFKSHTYYGKTFQTLYRRWKGLAKKL
ncbi:MAG: hypothetical protein K2X66_13890, partial [Cyanobacteria bacterium]|nr:hypothetical protein [Cyanobacteriota bacterium]